MIRLILLIIPCIALSQVRINTSTINLSSALEISSMGNNEGIIIPRMNQSQVKSLTSPPNGLLVYQTDLSSGFKYFDGCEWKSLSDNHYEHNMKNNISYVAAKENSNYSISIHMSSDIKKNLNWSRTGDVMTIHDTNHGLVQGDGVYIRNTNTSDFFAIVSEVTSNSFNVITSNSGNFCGSLGAYQMAITANVNVGAGDENQTGGNIQSIYLNKPSNSENIIVNKLIIYANDQIDAYPIFINNNYSNKSEIDIATYIEYNFPNQNFEVPGSSAIFKLNELDRINIPYQGWGESVINVVFN